MDYRAGHSCGWRYEFIENLQIVDVNKVNEISIIKPRSNAMFHTFQSATVLCIFIVASIISLEPRAMAIEKPSYITLANEGNFELRRYSSYIVAETFVEGNFEAVGSEGFRRLAGYIGGKNRRKESISMTAPVSQKPASEKIAMTAPVSQAQENGRWRITFMMPSA